MKRFWIGLAMALVLLVGHEAFARGGSGGHSHHSKGTSSSSTHTGGTVHVRGYYRKDGTYVAPHDRHAAGTAPATGSRSSSSTSATGSRSFSSPAAAREWHVSHAHYASGFVGARDANGRIVRSESAKRAFMKQSGYPHGRPGYVVDHITALKHGGADDPSNMQWQTIEDAKAKDRWE
jgi:hypothetical protein